MTKQKKFLKKLLTNAETSDKIKKSLESGEEKLVFEN